jgi:hypothetical protein
MRVEMAMPTQIDQPARSGVKRSWMRRPATEPPPPLPTTKQSALIVGRSSSLVRKKSWR